MKRADGERRIEIEQRHVAGRARGERSARQVEDARRPARHQVDEAREVDHARAHEAVVANGEGRLQPDDAKRR